ncbi:hypothetical protein J6590_050672 [Homalodisca vitripennis]|nr:hypothetical protein J6590_050672 [Homalodisca vitripennis]
MQSFQTVNSRIVGRCAQWDVTGLDEKHFRDYYGLGDWWRRWCGPVRIRAATQISLGNRESESDTIAQQGKFKRKG